MVDYDIRPYAAGDEQGILATFNRVFGEDDPGFEPRTLADWEWTYRRNPSGTRVWVAVQDGHVAAHYASQPNRVRVEGEQRIFGQILDSMVHPEHRQGLKRPGLFVETARRMLDATCGPDKDLVTYGWPNPDAWRMGKAFLQYELVRRQTILVRDLTRDPARNAAPGATELPESVELVESADERVDRLYERCAGEWGASTIRDAAWVNWRFFDCPRRDYELLVAHDADGEWAGYAAYRTSDWPIPHSGCVVDWLVPGDPEDLRARAAGEALRDAVLARARTAGVDVLLGIFPEWSPWFQRFQEWGFLVRSTDYLMSGRNNHRRHDMAWLRDHWWYQPVELDLV